MKLKNPADHYQLELALSHDAEVAAAPEATTNTVLAMPTDVTPEPLPEHPVNLQEPRLWRDAGWTARVIKSDDGDGWAVEMTKDGEAEPALVGPWTMGRDKRSPKPLDAVAFATLVKTASEVRRRHEQQMHAMLHKSVVVSTGFATVTVTLDIVPDEENSYATLSAYDETGTRLAQARVAPAFRLSKASAAAWIENDFCMPD